MALAAKGQPAIRVAYRRPTLSRFSEVHSPKEARLGPAQSSVAPLNATGHAQLLMPTGCTSTSSHHSQNQSPRHFLLHVASHSGCWPKPRRRWRLGFTPAAAQLGPSRPWTSARPWAAPLSARPPPVRASARAQAAARARRVERTCSSRRIGQDAGRHQAAASPGWTRTAPAMTTACSTLTSAADREQKMTRAGGAGGSVKAMCSGVQWTQTGWIVYAAHATERGL